MSSGALGIRQIVHPPPRGRAWAEWALTLIGLTLGVSLGAFALAAAVWIDGGLAYDTRAYWLAGRHVLDGTALYAPATVSTLGAFKYPPLFAQLFVPAAFLPELLVAWLWRAFGFLCLRYVTGSWRATIVACALPPVVLELDLGNVTLQLAAGLMFALRDRRGAFLVPWLAALKFGPALIVPYLWIRRPESRRPLIAGCAVFAAACLVSFALAPGAWSDYLATFGWESKSDLAVPGILSLLPASGGLDFALRFALAGAAVVFATWADKAWIAYAAAAITCPILAVSRLCPLVGWWRFRPADWPSSAGRSPAVAPPAAADRALLAGPTAGGPS